MRRDHLILAAAFALLCVGDIVTTAINLHIGRDESNPAALALAVHTGWFATFAVKAAIGAAILGVVRVQHALAPRVAGYTLAIADGFLLALVLWNAAQAA